MNTSHHNIDVLTEATGLTPLELIAVNERLIAGYSKLIETYGVLDSGHAGRLSYLGHLRSQNELLRTADRHVGGTKTERLKAAKDVRAAFESARRIKLRPRPEGGATLEIDVVGVPPLLLATNVVGDGLYLGRVEVLSARDFSIAKYMPLDTYDEQNTARVYARRVLKSKLING